MIYLRPHIKLSEQKSQCRNSESYYRFNIQEILNLTRKKITFKKKKRFYFRHLEQVFFIMLMF